ncbi:hypothetical protein [Psychrobacter phage vB_PmaS_Y8A]|nr:hypothetical protein [Psychrobacter phage vB_PmaS_Y8A]
MSEKLFVIKKPGVYWRANSCGYTNSRMEAGFYTEQEAKEVCDHPGSSYSYKPVSELFSLAELNEIESNVKTIRYQIELSEAYND